MRHSPFPVQPWLRLLPLPPLPSSQRPLQQQPLQQQPRPVSVLLPLLPLPPLLLLLHLQLPSQPAGVLFLPQPWPWLLQPPAQPLQLQLIIGRAFGQPRDDVVEIPVFELQLC